MDDTMIAPGSDRLKYIERIFSYTLLSFLYYRNDNNPGQNYRAGSNGQQQPDKNAQMGPLAKVLEAINPKTYSSKYNGGVMGQQQACQNDDYRYDGRAYNNNSNPRQERRDDSSFYYDDDFF